MLLQSNVARRLAGLAVAVASFSLVTSGCSGSVDKAGGAVPEPTRALTLLNPRFSVEAEPFVAEVAKVSAGTLVLEQGEQFERGSADSEVDAIKALQAGRADLAVIPVRAFGLVGVRSFDALIAPMEVDSMSLQQQVLSSDVATDMVSGVAAWAWKGSGSFLGQCGLQRELPDHCAPRKTSAELESPLVRQPSLSGASERYTQSP